MFNNIFLTRNALCKPLRDNQNITILQETKGFMTFVSKIFEDHIF